MFRGQFGRLAAEFQPADAEAVRRQELAQRTHAAADVEELEPAVQAALLRLGANHLARPLDADHLVGRIGLLAMPCLLADPVFLFVHHRCAESLELFVSHRRHAPCLRARPDRAGRDLRREIIVS